MRGSMSGSFPLTLFPRVLFRPREIFARITMAKPGARLFGWRAGAEPLALPAQLMVKVGEGERGVLFLSAARFRVRRLVLAMDAPTYRGADAGADKIDAGANRDTGACFALVAAAGTPLMAGAAWRTCMPTCRG